MNSSNSPRPKSYAASGGVVSYLFPDISEEPAAPAAGDGDDFHITRFPVDGGGFYGLLRHREKHRESPESLLADARAKAEAIEAKAYEEGLDRGMAEARALVEKDFETQFAALNEALTALEQAKRELEREAERGAVRLALAIARRVVCHEISTREETIFEVIHEALRQVPDPKSAIIRVSPSDYDRIKARAAAFSEDADPLEEMRMTPDSGIQDGDCIIDTPFGMVDARIEKRIGAVESALKSRLA